MPSVLFVCTANLFRSPLAQAFLAAKVKEDQASEGLRISSAGTWAQDGLPAHPHTVEAAGRFGLDLSQHRTRRVDTELLSRSDLVLVMELGHKEALQLEFPDQSRKIYLLSEVVDGVAYSLPDPFQHKDVQEQEIVDELHAMIARGHEKICALAESHSNHPEN